MKTNNKSVRIGPRAAASGLALVAALLAFASPVGPAAAASPAIEIIWPGPDDAVNMEEPKITIKVKVRKDLWALEAPTVDLEWQACPAIPGKKRQPCDNPKGGDEWEKSAKTYFTSGTTRKIGWFLDRGGIGFWRVRARIPDSEHVSAWRKFRIVPGVTMTADAQAKPKILSPRKGQRFDGDVVLKFGARVSEENCRSGQYQIEWRWLPPKGAGKPPPSWTNLQDMPKRLLCDPGGDTATTVRRSAFGNTGEYFFRVRHAWGSGSGEWSPWQEVLVR